MSALDQPLLSDDKPAQADVDSNTLMQIRAVLSNAGITADMINGSSSSITTFSSSADNGECTPDIEKGKRRSSLGKVTSKFKYLQKLSDRAESRGEEFDREYPLVEDIYNMFFISKNWSAPFFYAILTMLNKLLLMVMVIYWLAKEGGWVDEQKAKGDALFVVEATQLMLIPVAIGITEELMITCDVLSEYRWRKMDDHPQATKLKYIIANTLRLVDGLTWLFIISTLTFHSVDVLNMYLNFAALQFLQCVDNAAYEMGQKGYFTAAVANVTKDISNISLPSKRGTWQEYLDTFVLLVVFSLLILYWSLKNFLD